MANFKWTPEAVARLRKLAGTMLRREIAEQMGCTHPAVNSKMRELGIYGKYPKATPEVRKYAMRYQVSRRVVERTGIDRLNAMCEDARALLLHMHGSHRRPTHPATPSRSAWKPRSQAANKMPTLTGADRIERMMQLTERCA